MLHVQCIAPNNIMLQYVCVMCANSLKDAPKNMDIFDSTECFHGLGPFILLYYVTKYGQTM